MHTRSYTDRYGYGGILAALTVGAAFLAIALAPYMLTIVHAARMIGGAR